MNDVESGLWAAAVALYGVGDIVTTDYGLKSDAIHEGNPVAATILGIGGTPGMVLTKVVVLYVAFWAYSNAPEEHRVGIPLGLALLGGAIVLNNYQVVQAAQDE